MNISSLWKDSSFSFFQLFLIPECCNSKLPLIFIYGKKGEEVKFFQWWGVFGKGVVPKKGRGCDPFMKYGYCLHGFICINSSNFDGNFQQLLYTCSTPFFLNVLFVLSPVPKTLDFCIWTAFIHFQLVLFSSH